MFSHGLKVAAGQPCVAALAAVALGACAGGTVSTSSSLGTSAGATTVGASASATGAGTASGGSTGATDSGTSSGGSSGAAGGTSSGGTGSTGGRDAGCGIGNPKGVAAGTICYFPFDCACGLVCGPDITAGTANLICQYPCSADSDCPANGESCQKDAGLCLGGLLGSCSPPGGVNLEFYTCNTSTDCPCPLDCYPDPVLGPACERPCKDNSQCGALSYCNRVAGSCQQSCGALATLTEFQPCGKPTDCACPLSCYGDARRGQVCEMTCASDSDCADAGEVCETDAGACQRPVDCYGSDGGLSLFQPCQHSADCACPLNCVEDPLLTPSGAVPALKFCESCVGGNCETVPGVCQPPAAPFEFQASGILACKGNDACTCPNHCAGSALIGDLRCEQDCLNDSDCNDPGQVCRGGQCAENLCLLPLACDLINGGNYPPDAGDGTCFQSPPLNVPLCHSPGTSHDACDPIADRSETDEVCALGLACATFEDGGSHCVPGCGLDPADCADGDTCVPTLYRCLPFVDGGNCFLGGPPLEFTACGPGVGICGCAYDCVGGVCQQPCLQDSDCIDTTQICFGTPAQSYCIP